MEENHSLYMRRCLELAQKGKGFTSPNPMVGAVVVHNNRIIGEGYHRRVGEAHAEVNAIGSVRDQSLLQESTLYVNLEPCSHYGRTPPCAELIIQKRIPRVVIGCLDPYPEVSGRGVRMLLKAGVEVKTGVLENESRALNHTFITFQEKKRPYIYLKWAQSADGFLDRSREDYSVPATVFSLPSTRRLVHQLRAEVDAILVGTRTALLDNPSLTLRHWTGRAPVRVVIDRHLNIPSHYHLFDDSVPTIVFTARTAAAMKNTEFVLLDWTLPLLPQLLYTLYERRLHSLLVEGGSQLLTSFLEAGLWDEARIETAPFCLGTGVKAPLITSSSSPYYQQALQSIETNTICRYIKK
ncbi:diaminohydroxyphosphoribosylaminopyrimidine deaminase/5-amino-6-(5-phosphoribosylamino)uracil reductase [Parabacteroides sp. PFB2-10]|uniref:bifunctional diaminohydroxyphosphoribosylaminopyrimidine deaminase/5-amino-6-(5-phosphoribosylamino)uracil reductase RibD n=1 Tax=Parabacteroides sp. PFB2-10 TaxID=1742405 RepID=UPI002473AFFA|nr:bifunctional diaminohydroxyphosphoribosylaminopyrimidine deaminase/5-amino-6-(5-phosphoribosylamino)uracil reductase RibD [Parabacteroides sp. PFB2-10]MDH6312958.1 diaminohydroxyphosphoribosylaminopyrimidine deaminase/5-amino-6-(5-phosphoribosylamino)uracil reductase [Parabacteroides sp. PFB2-10]